MNGVAKGHHYPQGWGQPKMIMNMFEENNITSSGMDGWHRIQAAGQENMLTLFIATMQSNDRDPL